VEAVRQDYSILPGELEFREVTIIPTKSFSAEISPPKALPLLAAVQVQQLRLKQLFKLLMDLRGII